MHIKSFYTAVFSLKNISPRRGGIRTRIPNDRLFPPSQRLTVCPFYQDCQILLGSWYQKRKNVLNEHKIVQMAVKYVDIIQSKALQNLPKLVWKQSIWQPCPSLFWMLRRLIRASIAQLSNRPIQ
jgi:hypothetical protein